MELNRLSIPRHLSQVDSYRFFCFKPLSLVTQNTIFTRCDKFQMLCFLSEDNRVRSEARGSCVSQTPKHVAVCVFQPNLHDIRLTHMADSYCVLAFIQCAPADCTGCFGDLNGSLTLKRLDIVTSPVEPCCYQYKEKHSDIFQNSFSPVPGTCQCQRERAGEREEGGSHTDLEQ